MKENFSPEESLALIQSMISKIRENIGANRFYFLLWGWVIFSSVVMQFILKTVVHYQHHYLVWLLTIPAAFITIVMSKKSGRTSPRTWIGDSMGFFWMGIGISFFVLWFILSQVPNGWQNANPFFILFYGLGTFVSGKLLSFRPLVIGGIINWILAGVCVLVPYDTQLLVTAAAILCSYIIPGHLLKTEKQNQIYAA